MSDDDTDKSKHEVGFGKPPKHTQFQKGQSGNPKGRPKGSKNKPQAFPVNELNEFIFKECMEEITIQTGGNKKKVKKIEAVIKSAIKNAMTGDHRSQRLVMESFRSAEKDILDFSKEKLEIAIQYKSGAQREIDHTRKLGLPEPDILPHPEHILIDPRTGEVEIIGPMNKKEQREWDCWVARLWLWTEELESLNEELKRCKKGSYKDYVQKSIKQTTRLVEIAKEFVPDRIYIPQSTYENIKANPDIWIFEELR